MMHLQERILQATSGQCPYVMLMAIGMTKLVSVIFGFFQDGVHQ